MVDSYDNTSNQQSRFEISRVKDALYAPSTVGNKLYFGRVYLCNVNIILSTPLRAFQG